MYEIEKSIFKLVSEKKLAPEDAAQLLDQSKKLLRQDISCDIAITGISGCFPGGNDPEQFWDSLQNLIASIGNFPDARIQENLSSELFSTIDKDKLFFKGGYLDTISQFDPGFFNISPTEAKLMDPIQRLTLEAAYLTIEDAGYYYKDFSGTNTGVYIGTDHTWGQWYRDNVLEKDPLLLSGTWSGILSSRISYCLNLKGPSLVIDTACSSGLVAIHEACNAIRMGTCDSALAGGIQINYNPRKNPLLDLVESKDSQIRTFDKNANGTVWGEGSGMVLLKPLTKAISDKNHIHAIIKGSAVNNDGASDGITAPDPLAQEEVICQAWENASIDPENLSYIEAHGTGTKLGDSIEIAGLTKAFARYTAKKQFCAIGTVKTNIGHTVGASGLASLLKVILALKNKQIPASLNFSNPNPFINFSRSPVYLNDSLSKWDNGDSQRIAGISSFGFSGTNCHMVIEEAPVTQEHSSLFNDQHKFLFVLSAQHKGVLVSLIKKYTRFISCNPDINLNDFCYTAAIGRGHYSHRLAIIFTSYNELLTKLLELKNQGLKCRNGYYYHAHEIVQTPVEIHTGKEKYNPYITERERLQLNQKCENNINQIVNVISGDQEYIKLSEYYIQGAIVQWTKLYTISQCSHLRLPVYPFHKMKCWAAQNQTAIAVKNTDALLSKHPLLTKVDKIENGTVEYNINLSTADHWILNEHKVNQEYMLPGTAYIDFLISMDNQHNGGIEINDLVFLTPFTSAENSVNTLKIKMDISKKEKSFIIVSHNNQSDMETIHAQGQLKYLPSEKIERIGIETLIKEYDPNQKLINVNMGTDSYIVTGDRWNNIYELFQNRQSCLVHLSLDGKYQDDLAHYRFHPALLDNAVNIAIRSFDNNLYLPYYYQKIHYYHDLPQDFYSYVRWEDEFTANKSTMSFNISLFAPDGLLLAEIEGYTIKKVNNNNLYQRYFESNWTSVETTGNNYIVAMNGPIIVFTGSGKRASTLLEQIRNSYSNVIEVGYGNDYNVDDHGRFTVNTREDYRRFFQELEGPAPSKIIHLMSIREKVIDSVTQLKDAQEKSFFSVYYLIDSLITTFHNHKIEIILFSNYGYEVTGEEKLLHPHQSCLAGIGKVVREEYGQFKLRNIDIDDLTQAELILDELQVEEPPYVVAFRSGKRYMEQFSECNVIFKENDNVFREGGTYVISGGTGDLGLEIGNYICSQAKINIYLLARSNFPDRDKWSLIIKSGPKDNVFRKIKTIVQMEASGSKVHIYSVDISDEKAMKKIFDKIREETEGVNGVIHCAGVAGEGLLLRKKESRIREVMAAKVTGTWILDRESRNLKRDFFVMSSSISTILGGLGQSDYVAANCFLDAYSSYLKKSGYHGLTINWAPWRDLGMANNYNITDQLGLFSSLSPAQGIDMFAEILQMDKTRVIAGEILVKVNLDNINPYLLNDYVLSNKLKGILQKNVNSSEFAIQKEILVETDVKIKKTDGAEINEQERDIARIWIQVLGIQEISLYTNFEDLGGNSLLAVRLHKELENHYPGEFNISDVFSYPTISDMAGLLEKSQTATNAQEFTIEQVMHDLEIGKINADQADLLISSMNDINDQGDF